MKELTQLQYFRTVARMENLTKAAEQLHLSQPNLSRAIKRLEDDLGVPLFERTKGRLHLNKYGAAYLEYVDKAFEMLDAGESKLTEMLSSEAKPHIAVASVMWNILDDLLSSFTEHCQNVDVIFSYNQMEQSAISSALWNGSLDFALSTKAAYPPGVTWEPVFSCPICVLVSNTNPLGKYSSVSMSALRHEAFACNNVGINRSLTEQLCSAAGFEASIIFESNDGLFAGNWLEKKDCVAFIPAYDFLNLYQSGMSRPVKALRLQELEPILTLGLARPAPPEDQPSILKQRAMDTFYDYAISYFSTQNRRVQAEWAALWDHKKP